MEMDNKDTAASPTQIRYANLLGIISNIGLGLLILTFIMYVFGFSFAAPHIPVEDLVKTWGMSSGEFNKLHNVPMGWGWINLLAQGDFSNFIGIAILAGVTIVCYIQLCMDLLRENDKLMATIAFIEVIVLVVAATGIVGGAH